MKNLQRKRNFHLENHETKINLKLILWLNIEKATRKVSESLTMRFLYIHTTFYIIYRPSGKKPFEGIQVSNSNLFLTRDPSNVSAFTYKTRTCRKRHRENTHPISLFSFSAMFMHSFLERSMSECTLATRLFAPTMHFAQVSDFDFYLVTVFMSSPYYL